MIGFGAALNIGLTVYLVFNAAENVWAPFPTACAVFCAFMAIWCIAMFVTSA